MEAMHSALDASIYRALNYGPHFKAQIVNPKIYGPKWSLCRDMVLIFVAQLLSWPVVSCHNVFS